ncbi:uncharacterized protein LOC126381032 [Pectinophora gossypiella]|uniref:uncharacterized protein LOC126381032 n=1 Tax=Pectinophora gossypiella TaxID=13191 RepID=UPI00214EB0BE|nr:uncharacterized protein LOC126381032 [Pectinophora gossypiella]
MTTLIGNLSVFDHNSQQWEIFYGRLGQYLKLNADIKPEKKCALLLTHLSDDTYRLARNLVHPKELDNISYESLVEVLNKHFQPKRCNFADRAKFYDAGRAAGESIEEWAARLRGLAVDCDFGTTLETLLRDRFVLGMRAGPERDRLFEQDATTLTFARAVEIAQQAACARQSREILVKQEPVFHVHDRRSGGSGSGNGNSVGAGGALTEKRRCEVCGLKSHNETQCKYKGYRCRNCGQKGHLVKMCGKNKTVRVHCLAEGGSSPPTAPALPSGAAADGNDCEKCKECALFNLRFPN